MIRLLKLEMRKNFNYPAFWVIIGLHYFFLITVLFNIQDFAGSLNISDSDYGNMDLSMVPVLQFPDIWHNITYIAGFFKILLGIFIVIAITNEFQFNTIRLNLTNGLSRIDFITSKFLLIFMISLVSVFVVFAGGLLIGIKNYEGSGSIEVLDQSIFLIGYFLEILLYLVMALFIGIWLKRTGISIVALLIYPLLVEPIIRWQFPDNIDRFFPVNAMDDLIVFPFPKYFGFEIPESVSPLIIGIVIVWIIVFYALSIFILKRKSL